MSIHSVQLPSNCLLFCLQMQILVNNGQHKIDQSYFFLHSPWWASSNIAEICNWLQQVKSTSLSLNRSRTFRRQSPLAAGGPQTSCYIWNCLIFLWVNTQMNFPWYRELEDIVEPNVKMLSIGKKTSLKNMPECVYKFEMDQFLPTPAASS